MFCHEAGGPFHPVNTAGFFVLLFLFLPLHLQTTIMATFVSVNHYAGLCGVTVKTVYERIHTGHIRATKKRVGGRTFYYIDPKTNPPVKDYRVTGNQCPAVFPG